MEVECIGNTQIIHMEETGITQRTIGLRLLKAELSVTSSISNRKMERKEYDRIAFLC